MLGKLNSCVLKNEVRMLPNSIHKNKFKMEQRPKSKVRHYKKILEENTGRTLFDINQGKIFFDNTPPRTMIGLPCGSDGKASACNAEDPGSIPESGRSPGEGNGKPLQYSCLKTSMDRHLRSLVGNSPWSRKESDMTE